MLLDPSPTTRPQLGPSQTARPERNNRGHENLLGVTGNVGAARLTQCLPFPGFPSRCHTASSECDHPQLRCVSLSTMGWVGP